VSFSSTNTATKSYTPTISTTPSVTPTSQVRWSCLQGIPHPHKACASAAGTEGGHVRASCEPPPPAPTLSHSNDLEPIHSAVLNPRPSFLPPTPAVPLPSPTPPNLLLPPGQPSTSPSPTPSTPPVFGPTTCKRCALGTGGPCQGPLPDGTALCRDFLPGTATCPSDTFLCTCPACSYRTTGPCHGAQGRCFPYFSIGSSNSSLVPRCPAGSFECGVATMPVADERRCPVCYPGSQGPCQHPATQTCFGYLPGSYSCPIGTQECTAFDAALPSKPVWDSGQCSSCWGSSTGYVCGGGGD
jgi:hypothetical protein